MKYTRIMISALLLLLSAWTVQAAEWKLDAAHAEIRFDIQHIYVKTSGQFTKVDAAILFDPDHPEKSRFDFTVGVKSINTLNTKRDNHLMSKDFFNADKYPQMRFVSKQVRRVNGNEYAVEGILTIKDVSRPIVVPFYIYGPGEHPFDKKLKVVGFDASFSINRLDYKVGSGKFFKMGVVGDTVNIRMAIEALAKK